jgi:hypothetical protein
MQCYVCGEPAEDITPSDFDGIVLRCSVFGDFEIAGRHTPGEPHYLLDKLLAMDVHERKEVRESALRNTPQGQRPCIHSRTPGLI